MIISSPCTICFIDNIPGNNDKIHIEYPTLVKHVFLFVFFMIDMDVLNVTNDIKMVELTVNKYDFKSPNIHGKYVWSL